MMLRNLFAAVVVASLGVVGLSTEAGAYCYYNKLTWKRGDSALEAIPVYIDLGDVGDLRRTGLDTTTLISYVLTVVQELNRSSVTAPRLYYAGIRRPDFLVTLSSLPDGAGIHIRASLCSTDDVDSDDDGDLDDDIGGTGIASRGGEGTNRGLIRLRPLLDKNGNVCPVMEPWNTLGAKAISGGITECEEPYPGVIHPVKNYCIPF
jgi:hypothetical protein